MKILVISDLHGQFELVDLVNYSADVLIVAGDITNVGLFEEWKNYKKWCENQTNFKYILSISGNHDLGTDLKTLQNRFSSTKLSHCYEITKWIKENESDKFKFLNMKSKIIDGIKFFGVPYSNKNLINSWAWELNDPMHAKKIYQKIPEDVNVLITHSPVQGILDNVLQEYTKEVLVESLGQPQLRTRIKQLPNLKLVCCGHIHTSHGIYKQDNVTYINGSLVNEKNNLVFAPIEIEI